MFASPLGQPRFGCAFRGKSAIGGQNPSVTFNRLASLLARASVTLPLTTSFFAQISAVDNDYNFEVA
jgi:hypothetical protein